MRTHTAFPWWERKWPPLSDGLRPSTICSWDLTDCAGVSSTNAGWFLSMSCRIFFTSGSPIEPHTVNMVVPGHGAKGRVTRTGRADRVGGVDEPRREGHDDEALVLELQGPLRGGQHARGLGHGVRAQVREAERVHGVRDGAVRAEHGDLLRRAGAQEGKEGGDAVDDAEGVDLVLSGRGVLVWGIGSEEEGVYVLLRCSLRRARPCSGWGGRIVLVWSGERAQCGRVVHLLVLEAHPDGLPAHAAGVVDEDIQLSAADGGDFLGSALYRGKASVRHRVSG